MPVVNHSGVEKHFYRGQIGYWGKEGGKPAWSDTANNVWITPQNGGWQVSHRHSGGAFPRLFPKSWAPNHVFCLTLESAIKQAAIMVYAYKRARENPGAAWRQIAKENRK